MGVLHLGQFRVCPIKLGLAFSLLLHDGQRIENISDIMDNLGERSIYWSPILLDIGWFIKFLNKEIYTYNLFGLVRFLPLVEMTIRMKKHNDKARRLWYNGAVAVEL
jgi:hypothetical protein